MTETNPFLFFYLGIIPFFYLARHSRQFFITLLQGIELYNGRQDHHDKILLNYINTDQENSEKVHSTEGVLFLSWHKFQ